MKTPPAKFHPVSRVARAAVLAAMAFAGVTQPAATAEAGHLPATPKPNIVLFLIDDLGWRDVGCNGSTFYQTPNIDRLAREGVELYNLAEDLGETRNLAPAQAARVAELRRELEAWRRSVGAEMMRPNPDYDPTVLIRPHARKSKLNH